jgi:D-alanyl-lipoteichoic acid acyltransferase DltB (MBOAT superfamily)
MVVADRLASYINRAYASPKTATGGTLLVASIFFSIQIYADFSGYSDIARGSAKFFGIDLRNNFNFPYFATSIPDFWKRWNISLTSWFRDYLYIPLGGNRVSKPKWIRNQLVVFLLSGLWHGANWTFIFWGAIHGVFNLLHVLLFGKNNESKSRIVNLLRCIVTFAIVNTAWIFFRAPTFKRAIQIIVRIVTHPGRPTFGVAQVTFALNVIAILVLFGVDFAAYNGFTKERCPDAVRITGYALIACLIALLAVSSRSFIYLQF